MYGISSVATEHWGIQERIAMSDEQFRLWQTLIEARTGMTIGSSRRSFLETNLSIRMREIGFNSFDSYYETLMLGSSAEQEWATLIDRLTVQETSFFRHPSSFALVRHYIEDLLKNDAKRKHINIWSVGCSTGEEPYSLAMQTDMQLAMLPNEKVYFGVTASDISLPTLARARTGIYGNRRLVNVPEEWREKYFFQLASNREWQVVDSLKKRVAFVQMNVVELHRVPLRDMDIIFCQNVLIYFRRFRKRDILANLAERLAPGGLMVLGLGEALDWAHPLLERVAFPDTLAFRRKL
jgi:type IV pilus assembly protein PilK